MYIQQDKIRVFPFGDTRASDPTARIINEQNLSRLVNNLTDFSSYVVRKTDTTIDFVIEGYYFSVDVDALPNGSDVYALISFEVIKNCRVLSGGDLVSVISQGAGTQDNPYILQPGPYSGVLLPNTSAWYKYTFTDNGQQIVIKSGNFDSITINDLSEGLNFSDGVIKGKENDKCLIYFRNNNTDENMSVRMDVVYGEIFTGVSFVNNAPESGYYLHILNSEKEVPEESYIKFNSRSFGRVDDDTQIDTIFCGDASFLID